MEMPSKLTLPLVVISVLVVCGPTEAWYKQMSGPSYYSVGRASGLLSGIRRSPYARREEPQPAESGESASNSVFSDLTLHTPIVKTVPICIKDVTPDLQSCELLQEIKGSFRCKADVFLSLDSRDCAGE